MMNSPIAQNDQVIIQSTEDGTIVIDPPAEGVTVLVATPTATPSPVVTLVPESTKTASSICPRDQNGARFSQLCHLGFNNSTFGNIITIVFVIVILLSLIFLIWGGFKWILSGGDKGKIDGARSAIIAALVGLVIVFLSYFIINIIVPIFIPGFSLNSISLPDLY